MKNSIFIFGFILFSFFSLSQTQKRLPYERIMGNWHGTSICVDKKNDTACKDEEIVYSFVSNDTIPNSLLLHAYKVINGTKDHMGDLALLYSDSNRTWYADYLGRLRVRWSYQINDTLLNGTLIELPSNRLIRRVIASRLKRE